MKNLVDFKTLKNALIFALIYSLLFNSAVILHKYQYLQASFLNAIAELLKQYIYSYIALFVIFLGLALYRSLFIFGSIFLFLTGAVSSYYLFYLGVAPTEKMMPAIYGAEANEISELISVKLIIWLSSILIIFFLAIKQFSPQTPKGFVAKIISVICLFLAINNVISPEFRVLKTFFPIQYLHNSYVYFFGTAREKRADISENFKFEMTNHDKEIIGVLVIGESLRYANLGINGYHRDTTPRLGNIDNLLSFKGRSCENVTHLSVACLLSRHPEPNLALAKSETGFLSILTKLGYKTAWISTQSLNKYYDKNESTLYDEVGFTILPGGSALYGMNAHDGVMLPFISKFLEFEGQKFLTIQMSGSHWNYAERYPEAFAKFLPVQNKYTKIDQSGCTREELINSYDNSVLYTDFFLASLMDLLKNKKAFLIFASDHAESLGEGGRLGHGAEFAPEQREIPIMMWFSDSFISSYPTLASAAKQHYLQDITITHDYIFHTVLNCLGISGEIIDPDHSLCNFKTPA